jgi:hypothetical protein
MVDPEGHTRRISAEEFWDPAIVIMEETAQTFGLPWRDSWEILGTVSFSERQWISVVVRVRDPQERMMLQLMWPTLDKSWFWQRGTQNSPKMGQVDQ